ncbi:MAG TPA: hypothetical protein VH373_20320 [Jatrophihabitantaceae bacterium]|jgi:hypothetical protein
MLVAFAVAAGAGLGIGTLAAALWVKEFVDLIQHGSPGEAGEPAETNVTAR